MTRTRSTPTPALLLFAGCLGGILASCTQEQEALPASDDLTFQGTDEPVRVPAENQIIAAVTQPGVLSELEVRGFSLNGIMARGLGVNAAEGNDAAALYNATAWYKVLADDLGADIVARRKALRGVYGAPQTKEPRTFDYGYLRAQEANYELVAVVNRIDRKDFVGESAASGNCGELRFIYRMRYQKPGAAGAFSRLPMGVNVIFSIPDDGNQCAVVAKRWQVPSGTQNAAQYIDWVEKSPSNLGDLRFKQLEINMQANRYPSEAVPELGGSAEYFLRVYGVTGASGGAQSIAAKPLENTPDVARIKADQGLRKELAQYIQSHIADIDRGAFVIPEKFLAMKATSVSTHGTYRMINRAYSQIFKPEDLSDASFENSQLLNSGGGLLARLDDATCAGCHQGASIAGFHVVGTERLTRVHPLNATRIGTSAHFNAEEVRRKAYLAALIGGAEEETKRPLSFLEAGNPAGMHCVSQSPAGASASAFKKSFGCKEGLVCRDLERNAAMPIALGTCMHAEPSRTLAGEPCLGGDHRSADDASKDTLTLSSKSHPNCLPPVEGTPAGLVTRGCGPRFPASDAAHNAKAGEVCAYNGGAGFDACAASGDFSRCLGNADTFTRGLRGMCDAQTPCRDDYICQRFYDIKGSKATATSGPGFCVPTYFLFQMRVDGHASSNARWLD
jgi:hypothetical protein